jgi:Leucine-rich repeat (LRR) protein
MHFECSFQLNDALNKLHDLRILDLSSNLISIIQPKWWHKLANLRELNLARNLVKMLKLIKVYNHSNSMIISVVNRGNENLSEFRSGGRGEGWGEGSANWENQQHLAQISLIWKVGTSRFVRQRIHTSKTNNKKRIYFVNKFFLFTFTNGI